MRDGTPSVCTHPVMVDLTSSEVVDPTMQGRPGHPAPAGRHLRGALGGVYKGEALARHRSRGTVNRK